MHYFYGVYDVIACANGSHLVLSLNLYVCIHTVKLGAATTHSTLCYSQGNWPTKEVKPWWLLDAVHILHILWTICLSQGTYG